MYFNVVSCDGRERNNQITWHASSPHYALSNLGHRFNRGASVSKSHYDDQTWHWNDGDTVKFTLNLYLKTIAFQVNNKETFVAFDKIATRENIRYKLAFHMRLANSSITITQYSAKYVSDSDNL